MMTNQSDVDRQRKAWRQRNSDGRATFERNARVQDPPAFELTEHAMPESAAGVLANPDSATDEGSEYEARAIRHVHVWGNDADGQPLADPDAE